MQNIYILVFLFILNIILSPFLVSFLRNTGFYKKKELPKDKKVSRNDNYYKHLLENMSTPSSYGVLFILNLIILFFTLSLTIELKAVILGAIFLGLVGLADDMYQFFFYKEVGAWGFKARYKMILQLITFFLVFYTVFPTLWLAVILSLVATFILNSFNITDGLDGLAGGIAVPTFMTFGVLEFVYNGQTSLFFLIASTLIFLLIFMCYNIKPAKVFLGDSGSYAIGVILAYLLFQYNPYISTALISIFLLEGISSLIQIISLKVFKRRVFKIAPLHLHLLSSGLTQWQVIGGAWILQTLIVLIVLLFSNVGL
jgi:phospho-N-acetylmuramoyl-pentapeptide-transferase